jgi:hypothetical protein
VTNQHPITPPPELVQQWCHDSKQWMDFERVVAIRAAQWGADQELEACCEWMKNASFGLTVNTSAYQLRAARRPKPPSLKEQALGAMGRFTTNAHTNADEMVRDFDTIRRALEQLP